MDREKLGLLARKVAIAFGIGAGLVIILKAGPVIDALEAGDWPAVKDGGYVLLAGAIAGGLRALVALLTAFVPTDALSGVNLLGKWKDAPVVTTETAPTKIDVEP